MPSPADDVRRHERDWSKLAIITAAVGMCVGFWIGVAFAIMEVTR